MREKPDIYDYKEVKGAKLITVIATQVCIGAGTEKDPCRYLLQYWSLDGKLLAENDAMQEH